MATDDLTGRINGWACPECEGYTIAIHVDHGVTPFMLGCRATPGCKGLAQSMMYPKGPPSRDIIDGVAFEWFKLSRGAARRKDRSVPGTFDHWANGGLEIRELTDAGRKLLASHYPKPVNGHRRA